LNTMKLLFHPLFCALLAVFSAEAVPEATYYSMNNEARAYLSKPLAERRTEKRAMTAKVAPRQLSDGVPLVWTDTGKTPYSVTVRRMTDGKVFLWTQVSDANALSVFNLEIGFEYLWSVIDHAGKSVGSGQFTIADVPPRCVNVPCVGNMRDLGGWRGLDGRRVRQGLVYRSGWFDNCARFKSGKDYAIAFDNSPVADSEKCDFVPGVKRVSDQQTPRTMLGQLGIRTDLDLRSPHETFALPCSPLGEAVNYIQAPLLAYRGADDVEAKRCFAKAFRALLDARNYPIVFHCAGGKDRTGMLAFFANGLLGVAMDDLRRDYEFTLIDNEWRLLSEHRDGRFLKLQKAVESCAGVSLVEKFESYVKGCGFTDDDIAKFRAQMLEEPATPSAAKPAASSAPLLRFGVVSDVHVKASDDGTLASPDNLKYLLAAFRHFDEMKADAVVIAGDMANDGRVAELLAVGKAWDESFPDGRGSDGRLVEKVFIYGNHDPGLWPKLNTHGERLIANDLAGAWEEAFHEPFKPVYLKTVKGYDFIGVHWGNEGKATALIDAAGKSGKPFFHIQHPHVKGTVYGGIVGEDDGKSFLDLAKYPQAISFSGHTHMPLENEQSIWQGAFTAVGAASLRYIGISAYRNTKFARGYENGNVRKHSKDSSGPKVMVNEHYRKDMQEGLFVTVYADRIVISRLAFGTGKPVSIGADWIVPVGTGSRPYDLATRQKVAMPPAFPEGSKLTVFRVMANIAGTKESIPAWELDFPAARDALEYEITGMGPDGKPVVSWVYASKQKIRLAACRFAEENIRFRVVPLNSLGQRGNALE